MAHFGYTCHEQISERFILESVRCFFVAVVVFWRKPPLAEMLPKEAQAKAHVSARGLKRARAAEPQGPVLKM